MILLRELDIDTIRAINAFESITGSEVRDCIRIAAAGHRAIYFLINPGKAGLAIGKAGERVKMAERLIGCQIHIFEFDQDIMKFLKNLIPAARSIVISGSRATVSIAKADKGLVIGREGSNIKVLKELLSRNSNIRELRIV
jgi:NusA-like KH domain protein